MMFEIEAKIVRSQILAGEPRIDGRDTRTVRPIEIRTGVLPRVRPALFTRGETRAWSSPPRHRGKTLSASMPDRRVPATPSCSTTTCPPFATGETGRESGQPEAPRNRPRPSGQACPGAAAARQGRLRLHRARGLGNHRVQRFLVDGFRLRRLPGHDGRWRADEGPRGRYRHGSDQGTATKSAVLTDILGDEEITRATWTSRWLAPPPACITLCRWTSDPGYHQRKSCKWPWRKPRSPPAHPGQDG